MSFEGKGKKVKRGKGVGMGMAKEWIVAGIHQMGGRWWVGVIRVLDWENRLILEECGDGEW